MKMTRKQLAEVLKYSSPNIIYVVAWNNILQKVFCPFQVQVLENIGNLKKGELVIVDAVKVDLQLKTIYIINSQAYYYHYFDFIL
jgi:hypothetical protein